MLTSKIIGFMYCISYILSGVIIICNAMAAVVPARVLLLAIRISLTILGVHEFVFVTSQSPAASLCLGPVSYSEPRLLVPWFLISGSPAY